MKEAPKQIAARHKAAQTGADQRKEHHIGKINSKRNPAHNQPVEGVIKRDAKQGSARSGRVRVKEAIANSKGPSKKSMRFNTKDEFAC